MPHDFTLPSDTGEPFTVDGERRAQGVLLFFYRGYW